MSNASLIHVKLAPEGHAQLKSSAKSLVTKARASHAKFATYVPVDGKGSAVTVVLHEPASKAAHGAALAEFATKTHPRKGIKALAAGPKRGVAALHSRTAHITSRGKASAPKPYALALVVSYDPAKGAELRRIGQAVSAHNPSFRHHVIRRDGVKGHAIVVIPVNSLDEYDKPVKGAAKHLVGPLAKAVKSVSLIKLRRVADLSA